MAEERRKRISSGVLWIAAAIALVLIFFGVRRLTREKLPLRVAESQVQDLVKASSTNGRVEPQHIFEAHAPDATTVKAVYVHVGEQVRTGQLLVTLDDTNARARLAAATAALRAAEAGYQRVESGGTHQEQLVPCQQPRQSTDRSRPGGTDLDVMQKLAAKGAAAPSEVAQAQTALADGPGIAARRCRNRRPNPSPRSTTRAKSSVAEAEAAVAAAATGHRAIERARSLRRHGLFASRHAMAISSRARRSCRWPTSPSSRCAPISTNRRSATCKLNNPVSIVWDAKPDLKFHGRITRLPSTIIDYGTRRVGEVLISIEDSNGVLLPNTNVVVTVVTHEVQECAHRSSRGSSHRGRARLCLRGLGRHAASRAGAGGRHQPHHGADRERPEGAYVVALGTTNGAPLSEGVPIRIVN